MTDWRQIIEQHGPGVWRTCQRLLGREADAADCFQATFISALALESGQIVRCWPALLRRLATARSLERLRQRARQNDRFAHAPDDEELQKAIDGKALPPEQWAVDERVSPDAA